MTNVARLRLLDDVAAAASIVAPSWPLSSVIAVNPLSGFEDRPFERALDEAEALFGTRGLLTLDEYRAAAESGRIEMPQVRAALHRRFGPLDSDETQQRLAEMLHDDASAQPVRQACTVAERHDREHGTQLRRHLDIELSDWCAQWAANPHGDFWSSWQAQHPIAGGHLPTDPLDALTVSLEELRVPHYAQREYLAATVAALPGWASHLRWQEVQGHTTIMTGFLAAMVASEAHLVEGIAWFVADGPLPRTAPWSARAWRELVWQDAYERTVHDRLLGSLAVDATPRSADSPRAQVVCCIDVRSEGLRRHLEAVGPYETFGYAGFFGLAARIAPVSGEGATDQCPVLLDPAYDVAERGPITSQRTVAGLDDAWKAAKYNPIAPLALAEGAGWLAGPVAAIRTASPGLLARVARRSAKQHATSFDLSGMPLAVQADVVAGVCGLGIGSRPAPLVVLCGHDAHVDNNPMESGLTCGACGGHSGAPNARVVAAMANDPEVRAELMRRGISLPESTWFLAAVHETTTDEVTLLDTHLVPESHLAELAALRADLVVAGEHAALERAATLPGAPRRLNQVRRRARDWAEPVAELGLAGNIAFVIGPRSLTAGVDLGRRVFLHSYEPVGDADGSTLAGILTAPLVVAQWINAQYNFSTTDPEEFGSGSKAVHNVLGDIGVLSGAGGDLRRGLPLQSVRAGDRLLHEPVRLLAVVYGRRDHIDAAIAGSPTLRQLVDNEWIGLVAREPSPHDGPAGSTWQRRTATGWVDHSLVEPDRVAS